MTIKRSVNVAKKLQAIHSGYGAAVLGRPVKGLVLVFALPNKDGHMGPRKFWKENLPRIIYHNPMLDVQVRREVRTGGPATLTIVKDSGNETIDMQHKHSSEICRLLLEKTDARAVE